MTYDGTVLSFSIHQHENQYNEVDMIDVILISFDFQHPFLWWNSYFWQNLFVKHWQNSCCSPPIDWSNHAYLVSQRLVSEHSVSKNVFLPYGTTRVTYRNIRLNDSDNGILFHRLAFTVITIVFLCVLNLWCNTQNRRNHCNAILVYFVSLFYHLSKFQKNKNGIMAFIPPKLNTYTLRSE